MRERIASSSANHVGVRDDEADGGSALGLGLMADRFDIVAVWTAELDAEGPFRDDRHAERFERLDEERLARCIIRDSKYDVVKHDLSPMGKLMAPRTTVMLNGDTRDATEAKAAW